MAEVQSHEKILNFLTVSSSLINAFRPWCRETLESSTLRFQ
jgi:hypothetical protein